MTIESLPNKKKLSGCVLPWITKVGKLKKLWAGSKRMLLQRQNNSRIFPKPSVNVRMFKQMIDDLLATLNEKQQQAVLHPEGRLVAVFRSALRGDRSEEHTSELQSPD